MRRYWTLHGKGTPLCSLLGKKVNQKPVVASSMYLLAAQPCRDPAFPSSCSVTQAAALGFFGSPQTCPPVLLRGSAVKSSFPRQLAVVPQTRDCSFTAGWGSSISLAAAEEEEEGKEEEEAPALCRSQECEGGCRAAKADEGSVPSRRPAGASRWLSPGGGQCHMCLLVSSWVTPLGFSLW